MPAEGRKYAVIYLAYARAFLLLPHEHEVNKNGFTLFGALITLLVLVEVVVPITLIAYLHILVGFIMTLLRLDVAL